MFRLTFYDTTKDNKYEATDRHEYLGNKESVFKLWYLLTKVLGKKHVEIFSLDGQKQNPESGLLGLTDYNL